jgi:hypothetical protein
MQEEGFIVMRFNEGQYRVGGIGNLDKDFAFPILAAGAAAHLFHQLKSSFIGAEFGEVNDTVGVEDTDEVDMFEVQSFHDHLRADEDVDPLLLELLDERIMGGSAFYAVDVHAGDAGLGKDGLEMFFDPFGPEIALDEAMVAAGGAGGDGRVYRTAIVAMQFVGQFVKIQRYVTVAALGYPPADFADLVGGVAAAVLEKDDLFAGGEGLFDGCVQGGAEDGFAVVAGAGFVGFGRFGGGGLRAWDGGGGLRARDGGGGGG